MGVPVSGIYAKNWSSYATGVRNPNKSPAAIAFACQFDLMPPKCWRVRAERCSEIEKIGRTISEAGVVNSESMNSLAVVAIAVILAVTGRTFNVVIDEERGLPSADVTKDDFTVSAFAAWTDVDQQWTQLR